MEPRENTPHPVWGIQHYHECEWLQGGACTCHYEYTLSKLKFFNGLGPDPDLE